MAVIHFDQASFHENLAKGGVMMVDFWATWCGPCKMIAPAIEEIADEYEGKVVVGKVDVDRNMELAMQFGIQSIPNVCFFKGGELVDRVVGAVPMSEFTAVLDKLI